MGLNISMSKANAIGDFFFLRSKDMQKNPTHNHLASDYVPLVHEYLIEQITKRLQTGIPFSVFHDGCTNGAENFCINARYVLNGEISTVVLRLCRCKTSLNAEEIVALLVKTVMEHPPDAIERVRDPDNRGGYGLRPSQVAVIGHDRAGSNERAMGNTQTFFVAPAIFSNADSIGCWSHTATHAAEKISTACTLFAAFWHLVVGTMSRSGKAKESYRKFTGHTWIRWSKTRWFGERDAILEAQPLVEDGQFQGWIFASEFDFTDSAEESQYNKLRRTMCPTLWGRTSDDNTAPADEALRKLAEEKWFMIRFEMMLIVELTAALRRLTYNAEGNGPLALVIYDEYDLVRLEFLLTYAELSFPGVKRLIAEKQATTADEEEKQQIKDDLIQYGKVRYKPAIDYFEDHFSVEPTDDTAGAPLFKSLQMFKGARLCNPDFMRKLALTAGLNATITEAMVSFRSMKILTLIPEMYKADEEGLRSELPAYIAACAYIDYGNLGSDNKSPFKEKLECLVEFWKKPSSDFPTWRKLAHYLFLFQPSVACVDRGFSMLRLILLRPGMNSALVDLIEATLMEMYNTSYTDAEMLEELLQHGL
jgi:hypothetical protein